MDATALSSAVASGKPHRCSRAATRREDIRRHCGPNQQDEEQGRGREHEAKCSRFACRAARPAQRVPPDAQGAACRRRFSLVFLPRTDPSRPRLSLRRRRSPFAHIPWKDGLATRSSPRPSMCGLAWRDSERNSPNVLSSAESIRLEPMPPAPFGSEESSLAQAPREETGGASTNDREHRLQQKRQHSYSRI